MRNGLGDMTAREYEGGESTTEESAGKGWLCVAVIVQRNITGATVTVYQPSYSSLYHRTWKFGLIGLGRVQGLLQISQVDDGLRFVIRLRVV